MHELGLAKDILEKIRAQARAQGLSQVGYAKVRVGETLLHDPAELKQIFADISKGIKLDLEISKLKAVCSGCQQEFDAKTPRLDCPVCGSGNLQIISGNELRIEDLK